MPVDKDYFKVEKRTTYTYRNNKGKEEPVIRISTPYKASEITLWFKGVISIKTLVTKGKRTYLETIDLPTAPLKQFLREVGEL